MSNVKISIITIVYNRVLTIGDAINSVESQNYKNIEYIVIDGGSTDGSKDVIEGKINNLSVYISEKDGGIYDALNKGIDRSTGDIIGILHSDDIYASDDCLSVVANYFNSDPSIDILIGNVKMYKNFNSTHTRKIKSSFFRKWMLRFGFMPPHTSTFIRRNCYDIIGRYSTKYRISSDFDWFCRAYNRGGFNVKKIDNDLVFMREGGISTAGMKSIYMITNEIRTILRNNFIYSNYLLILIRLPIKFLFKYF